MAKGGIWSLIFYEPITIIWVTIIMLLTGLFVSFFIGDRILLSGIKHEKKIEEKTEEEVVHEEMEISQLSLKIDKLTKDIEEIKEIYREGLTFHYVDNILQVLEFVLLKEKVKKPLN